MTVQRVRIMVMPTVLVPENNKLSQAQFLQINETRMYQGKFVLRVDDAGTDQMFSFIHYYDLTLVDSPDDAKDIVLCISTINVKVEDLKKAKYIVMNGNEVDVNRFVKNFLSKRYHIPVTSDTSQCTIVI